MHYHCEIVMPPVTNIAEAVASVLDPFDEANDDTDEDFSTRHAFWDYWVIGGRYAGEKLIAKLDKQKIDAFYEWLSAEKITVSGVKCGKHEISPADQISKVDAKWNEMFPSNEFAHCPLFQHSNNQYGNGLSGTLPDDVQTLSDTPPELTCNRVIFAGPSFDSETRDWTGPLKAVFMLCDSQWNGCNYMKVDWDGTLGAALNQYRERPYTPEVKEKRSPRGDWLVVTVDYHN